MALRIGHWGHDNNDWGAVWEAGQGLIPHLAWNQKKPPKVELLAGLQAAVDIGRLEVGSPVMLYTHNMFTWWREGIGRLLNPFVSSETMFQRGAGRFRGWTKQELRAYLEGDDRAKDGPLARNPDAQNVVNLLDILRIWRPSLLIQADNFEGAGTETSLARARSAQGAFEARYPEMGWTEMEQMSDDELRAVLHSNWRRMFTAYLDGLASVWPGEVQLITYGGPESVVSVGGHDSRFFVEPGAEPPPGEGQAVDTSLLYQTVMEAEPRYIPLASMYLHDWEAATLNGMASNPLWRLMSWTPYSRCRGQIFWDGGVSNKTGDNDRQFPWCTPEVYASMVKACALIGLPELALLYRDHGASAADVEAGHGVTLDPADVEVENDLAAAQALRELASWPDFTAWWSRPSQMVTRPGVHPGDKSRPVNFDRLPLWALEVVDEPFRPDSWPTLPWGDPDAKAVWNPNWRSWNDSDKLYFSRVNAFAREMPSASGGRLFWLHVMNLRAEEVELLPVLDAVGTLALVYGVGFLAGSGGTDVFVHFDKDRRLTDIWTPTGEDRISAFLEPPPPPPPPPPPVLEVPVLELFPTQLMRLSPDVLRAPGELGRFRFEAQTPMTVFIEVDAYAEVAPGAPMTLYLDRQIQIGGNWEKLPPAAYTDLESRRGRQSVRLVCSLSVGVDVMWELSLRSEGEGLLGDAYITVHSGEPPSGESAS